MKLRILERLFLYTVILFLGLVYVRERVRRAYAQGQVDMFNTSFHIPDAEEHGYKSARLKKW